MGTGQRPSMSIATTSPASPGATVRTENHLYIPMATGRPAICSSPSPTGRAWWWPSRRWARRATRSRVPRTRRGISPTSSSRRRRRLRLHRQGDPVALPARGCLHAPHRPRLIRHGTPGAGEEETGPLGEGCVHIVRIPLRSPSGRLLLPGRPSARPRHSHPGAATGLRPSQEG